MNKITIYFDGASRGNPGDAGIGIVFVDKALNPIKEFHKYIGKATNNVAEYTAFCYALSKAKEEGYRNIDLKSDSELLVKQINGEYAVKSLDLKPLYVKAKKLLENFENYTLLYIQRTQNKMADKLANTALNLNKTSLESKNKVVDVVDENKIFKDMKEDKKIRKHINLSRAD
ncbi:ribonuclease HI family protein [Candidatus Poribacteria bacterium]|nr:ribonuclease HI family protein [Candidatus Poribacteria bacterium]